MISGVARIAEQGHVIELRIDLNEILRQTAVSQKAAIHVSNGGAAVQADSQVMMIKQYLEDLTYPPVKDTNMVAQLQSALVVAREKARVLSEDCRRRGHRETHPWKTNWATIKQALTAFEKSNQ